MRELLSTNTPNSLPVNPSHATVVVALQIINAQPRSCPSATQQELTKPWEFRGVFWAQWFAASYITQQLISLRPEQLISMLLAIGHGWYLWSWVKLEELRGEMSTNRREFDEPPSSPSRRFEQMRAICHLPKQTLALSRHDLVLLAKRQEKHMEILRASILTCDFGFAIFIIRSFDELKLCWTKTICFCPELGLAFVHWKISWWQRWGDLYISTSR